MLQLFKKNSIPYRIDNIRMLIYIDSTVLLSLIKSESKIYLLYWCDVGPFEKGTNFFLLCETSYEDLADLKLKKKDLPDLIPGKNKYVGVLLYCGIRSHIYNIQSKNLGKAWLPDYNKEIHALLPTDDWHLWKKDDKNYR